VSYCVGGGLRLVVFLSIYALYESNFHFISSLGPVHTHCGLVYFTRQGNGYVIGLGAAQLASVGSNFASNPV
jgi:hypothetical protein